jgi:hypothetical protein
MNAELIDKDLLCNYFMVYPRTGLIPGADMCQGPWYILFYPLREKGNSVGLQLLKLRRTSTASHNPLPATLMF